MPDKKATKQMIVRIACFLAAVAIIAYFYPDKDGISFSFKVGKPWTYSLLTAPFDMPIRLDSATIKAKKDSIDHAFVPIFKRNAKAEQSTIARLQNYKKVSPHHKEISQLEAIIVRLYRQGIVDNSIYEAINGKKLKEMRMHRGNEMKSVSTANMISVRRAYEITDSIMLNSPVINQIRLSEIIEPNIVKDSIVSDRMLNDLYNTATAPSGIIQKGERIVDRGEIITPQTAMLLDTYTSMMTSRNKTVRDARYPVVGYLLIVAALFFLLQAYLYIYRKTYLQDLRKLTFILLLITVMTLFSMTITRMFHNGIYLLPIALVPIMLVTFFDARTAFFASVIQVLLCSLITEYPLEFILLHLSASIIAISTLQELTRRSQLVRTALLVFVGYCVIFVAATIMFEGNINKINPKVFLYFGINTVMLSFAYVLIFIVEKLFGFVSKVTLVELSDVNNPLLRELSERCPGTFQHSLQLSNLVTEAIREIGGNTQLARAGALYHDIGKMENPAFFTENQHDVNPHTLLAPEQSAKIVIQHVTDGVKIADKAKLPSVIKNFILEHHGKSLAKFFYTTACNANGGDPVDPAPYTYPGPNPRSKETSVLMMADATEAASRSLKEYSDAAISGLVNRIIDGQIAAGLMKDSPLSFRDVETVKRVFISRLRTMYHTRVQYPELIKKDSADNKTTTP